MHKVGDVAVAIVAVAGIMVLTRKGSTAAAVIGSLGGAFAQAIGAAVGNKPASTTTRQIIVRKGKK